MVQQLVKIGDKIWKRSSLAGSHQVVKILVGSTQANFIVEKKTVPELIKAAGYWEDDQSQINDIGWGLDTGSDPTFTELPESREGPEEMGFGIGDSVMITDTLDTFRIPRGTEAPYGEGEVGPSQGGEVINVGLNETGEIVGLNQDPQGAPLEGSMLVKLPSGRLVVVFPDEVQKM